MSKWKVRVVQTYSALATCTATGDIEVATDSYDEAY